MNILIDIGNTACKVASSSGKEIGRLYRFEGDDITAFIIEVIHKECVHGQPDIIVLSSVRNKDEEMERVLSLECRKLIVFDTDYLKKEIFGKEIKKPEIEVLEKMPEGMGADRMAAILAAHTLFPERDLMLFDFGTATTIEFINGRRESGLFGGVEKPEYLGGSISLGLNTRYRALHQFTRKIPLLNPNDFLVSHNINEISTIGFDLDTALAAGNILGIMFEIQGYMAVHPDRTVVFTGGDAVYFAERLKNSIFVVYNLVLMGLSQIAQYNVEN